MSPDEKAFLEDQVRKLANVEGFIVEATEDSLIVHASEDNREEAGHLSSLAGLFHTEGPRQWRVHGAQYHPMRRFTLTDEARRLISLERWCFRGRIDGWIHLGMPHCPLDELATEFLPHLGQESFYELI